MARLGLGVLVACVVSLPAMAGPISGTFSSPLGPLAIKETDDGTVTGTITDKKNPCGFAKGTAVFNGARLDESVAGSFRMCKVGDGCSGTVDGDAILLVGKGGALLSGTVHLDTGGACKTPLGGEAITLRKAGVKAAVAPKPAPKDARARAEALAREAHPLLMNEKAEDARKLCQEAVKVDPQYSEGYTCIGATYFIRDRYEEAEEQYKIALEVNPANPDAYYNIACIFSVQNKIAESLEYLKLAVMNGYIDLKTLSSDSDLKNLNGNPVFEKLKLGQFD
jgi:hypothetical protein